MNNINVKIEMGVFSELNNLSIFDKEVYTAVCTLYHLGNTCMTQKQIYYMMGYLGTPTEYDLCKIHDSMKKLMTVRFPPFLNSMVAFEFVGYDAERIYRVFSVLESCNNGEKEIISEFLTKEKSSDVKRKFKKIHDLAFEELAKDLFNCELEYEHE